MENFGKRAYEIRKYHNYTQDEFAHVIGAKNKQTVSNVENGKQKKYTDEEINKIIDKFKVNKTWFLVGEGSMFEKSPESQADNGNIAVNSKMIKAPIMSVKASAGNGREQHEVITTGELLIDRMLFKVLPNLKNIRAIEVEGDSMYPTLKEGDYVVIEENMNFTGDGIYVLHYDGVLLVKRLQADIDGIEILSDNQSYGKRKYDPNDDQRLFHIAGKVILRMQR